MDKETRFPMTLQWFAGEGEGGGGQAAEDAPLVILGDEFEDFVVEEVVPPSPPGGAPPVPVVPPAGVVTKEMYDALLTRFEGQQAILDQLKAGGDITKALEMLTQRMGQPPAPAEKPLTLQEFQTKYNELMSEDPFAAIEFYQKMKVAPLVTTNLMNNLATSRRFVELDPARRENYARYQKEVEDWVRSRPQQEQFSDPDIYRKAVDALSYVHIDDIVAERVKAELAKGGTPPPNPNPAAPVLPPNFSETNQTLPAGATPGGGKKTAQLSKTEAAEVIRLENKGLSRRDAIQAVLLDRGA